MQLYFRVSNIEKFLHKCINFYINIYDHDICSTKEKEKLWQNKMYKSTSAAEYQSVIQ
jgi:hypothetical protein